MAKGNILGIKNMVAATNSVVDLFCRKFCKTCEKKKHTGLMIFQSELWTKVGKMLKREDRCLMVKSMRPIKQQCFAFYSNFMCHKTGQLSAAKLRSCFLVNAIFQI